MSNTNEQTSQQSKPIADAKEYLASLGMCPQKLDEYLDQFPTKEHAIKLGTLILEIVFLDMKHRYEDMTRTYGPRKAKRLMAYYCLHSGRLTDTNISIEQSYRIDKQIGRLSKQVGARRNTIVGGETAQKSTFSDSHGSSIDVMAPGTRRLDQRS